LIFKFLPFLPNRAKQESTSSKWRRLILIFALVALLAIGASLGIVFGTVLNKSKSSNRISIHSILIHSLLYSRWNCSSYCW